MGPSCSECCSIAGRPATNRKDVRGFAERVPRKQDCVAAYSASDEHLQRHAGDDTSRLPRYLRSGSSLGTQKHLAAICQRKTGLLAWKACLKSKGRRPFFTRLLRLTPFPILQKQ